ncbi:MAG: hypothetical protein JNL60_16310 [Bacteroidia bacterium]|nr:hypothetical protein [Bacteroidia bacterium]
MSGNKYKKILVSSLLLILALWIATPKVFIHNLMGHDHSGVELSKETKVKSQSNDDCDFEKYNKPVYFSLFKFICSFIPSKSKTSSKIAEKAIQLSGISYAISLFRGPPVME